MGAEPFHEAEIVEAVVREAERSLLGAVAELERLERAPNQIERLDEIYLRFYALAGNAGLCGLGELAAFSRRVSQSIAELVSTSLAVSRPQLRLIRQSIELSVVLLDGSQLGPSSSRTRDAFLARLEEHCALAAGESETPPDGDEVSAFGVGCDPDQRAANNAPPQASFDLEGPSLAELDDVGIDDTSDDLDMDELAAEVLEEIDTAGDRGDAVGRLEQMIGTVSELIVKLQDASHIDSAERAGAQLELRQVASSLGGLASELENISAELRRRARDVGCV